MSDSIFTKIIKGEIPAYKIYEDDKTLAFLDIHPKQPGHTVVVPKSQIDVIWELDDESYRHLWATAKKIADHMQSVLGKRIGAQVEGIGVPHAHIHLFPFETTDEFLVHQDMHAEPDHSALAAMAKKLEF